jgi:glycerol-3-phosphate dehydrogenase
MPTRQQRLENLQGEWDIAIIGGGATGLGTAVDAAARGFRTLLLESRDFASGTSSRSTKLVHGGVRYLEQGDIPLVLEALRERGLLHRNAPHLVHALPFIVPRYKWWEGPFFGIGLKMYDALAGRLNLSPSRMLDREETLARIPNLEAENLLGGVEYFDGQFDDARLAVSLVRTAESLGATVLNYCPVTAISKRAGMVRGLEARDAETGGVFHISARVVINATGIFADSIRRMDESAAAPAVQPSQGVHLVLDRDFLQGETAIMVPHTDDGRVLFVIPWHGRVLVGTTDTPMATPDVEPRALPEEITFILRNAARYLARDPGPADIRCIFAGQRPLVRPPRPDGSATKSISRNHEVLVSDSGLVSIVGGKWTTYRQMAEDVIDVACGLAGFEETPSPTRTLPIHGFPEDGTIPAAEWLRVYGAEAAHVEALAKENPDLAKPLARGLPYSRAAAIWAVRHESARGVEDVLARRTRALLLDARAAAEAAESTALLIATELGQDDAWAANEARAFRNLALGYRAAARQTKPPAH